jgi:hypothetical protein
VPVEINFTGNFFPSHKILYLRAEIIFSVPVFVLQKLKLNQMKRKFTHLSVSLRNLFLITAIILSCIQVSHSQVWSHPQPGGVCVYGVNTLVNFHGDIYAGGVTQITRWNGSTWAQVVSVQTVGVDQIWAFTVYNGELYISGDFTFLHIPANYIVKYDGINWSTVGGGLTGIPSALGVYNNELYATGYNGAALYGGNAIVKWNGTSWSSVGTNSSITGYVADFTTYHNEFYACGYFTDIGGVGASNIAKWDGSTWAPLGLGTNYYTNIMYVYGNELYAGGYFTGAGGLWLDNIARWNGTTWNDVGGGILGPSQGSLSAEVNALVEYNGSLFVAGEFSNAGGTVTAYNIAKWDGTIWYDIGGTAGGGVCGGSYGLGVYDEKLFVGGLFDSAGFIPAFNIAVYDETIMGINISSDENVQVSLSPNPFSSSFKINFSDESICNAKFILYDVTGREVLNAPVKSSETIIRRNNLQSGIYLWKIFDEKELISCGKIIAR